jgi:hypothetical protein
MAARRIAVALLALALLALVRAPMAGATPVADTAFVTAINAARSASGLPAYANRSDLHQLAQRQAQRMADADGQPFHNANLAGEAGSGWKMLGENVGVGLDVTGLHRSFMGSTAHRNNILSHDFTEVGVGTALAKSGRLFVAEVFRLPASPSSAVATPAPAPSPAPAPAPAPNRSPAPTTTAPRPAAPTPAPTTTTSTTVAPTTTTLAPTTTVDLDAARAAAEAQLAELGDVEAAAAASATPVTTDASPHRALAPAALALALAIGLGSSGAVLVAARRRHVASTA